MKFAYLPIPAADGGLHADGVTDPNADTNPDSKLGEITVEHAIDEPEGHGRRAVTLQKMERKGSMLVTRAVHTLNKRWGIWGKNQGNPIIDALAVSPGRLR